LYEIVDVGWPDQTMQIGAQGRLVRRQLSGKPSRRILRFRLPPARRRWLSLIGWGPIHVENARLRGVFFQARACTIATDNNEALAVEPRAFAEVRVNPNFVPALLPPAEGGLLAP
jgi:hypothetical protein